MQRYGVARYRQVPNRVKQEPDQGQHSDRCDDPGSDIAMIHRSTSKWKSTSTIHSFLSSETRARLPANLGRVQVPGGTIKARAASRLARESHGPSDLQRNRFMEPAVKHGGFPFSSGLAL